MRSSEANGMVRQARAELTRALIVRSAAELFDRHGYGATSLADIVQHAGVTKGSLYFHFTSKEDVAHAVIEEQHALWVAHARKYIEDSASALESLICMSFGLAGYLMENAVIRGGIRLTLEHGTFQRPVFDPYLDWMRIVEELLDRAAAEHDTRPGLRTAETARFVVTSFTGLQMVAQALDGRRTLPDRVAEMWHVLLPGMVTPRRLPYYLDVAVAARRDLPLG